MNNYFVPVLLISAAIFTAGAFYLYRILQRDKDIIALAGLFCLAMGFFLLLLDLFLIATTQGPQYIPAYLRFNRLVSDTGFAGRWMLTVYLFIGTGIAVSIYLLARNLIKKFNN